MPIALSASSAEPSFFSIVCLLNFESGLGRVGDRAGVDFVGRSLNGSQMCGHGLVVDRIDIKRDVFWVARLDFFGIVNVYTHGDVPLLGCGLDAIDCGQNIRMAQLAM